MKKGDIILIPFPFTDFSGNKVRPALVLVNKERDIIVAFISTQINWKEEGDVLLEANIENGLKKKSLIRLSKLATVDKDFALGRLGSLKAEEILQVNKNLKEIFMLE